MHTGLAGILRSTPVRTSKRSLQRRCSCQLHFAIVGIRSSCNVCICHCACMMTHVRSSGAVQSKEVERLNGVYNKLLKNAGVDLIGVLLLAGCAFCLLPKGRPGMHWHAYAAATGSSQGPSPWRSRHSSHCPVLGGPPHRHSCPGRAAWLTTSVCKCRGAGKSGGCAHRQSGAELGGDAHAARQAHLAGRWRQARQGAHSRRGAGCRGAANDTPSISHIAGFPVGCKITTYANSLHAGKARTSKSAHFATEEL